MTNSYGPPSEVVARQVQEIRRRRGWTAAQLAERCKEIGAEKLTAQALANIENGRKDKATGRRRRDVTVDELMALSIALEVAPVHLLVPLDDDAPYEVTASRTLAAFVVRDFVRGVEALPGIDLRAFYGHVPEKEFLQVTYDSGKRTVEVGQKRPTGPGE